LILENNFFASDRTPPRVQHHGKKGVITLRFDPRRLTCGKERFEKMEGERAALRKQVKLEDGARSFPGTVDQNGPVAGRLVFGLKAVWLCPTGPGMHGVMHNLTIHFLAVEITPACDVLDTHRIGGESHL